MCTEGTAALLARINTGRTVSGGAPAFPCPCLCPATATAAAPCCGPCCGPACRGPALYCGPGEPSCPAQGSAPSSMLMALLMPKEAAAAEMSYSRPYCSSGASVPHARHCADVIHKFPLQHRLPPGPRALPPAEVDWRTRSCPGGAKDLGQMDANCFRIVARCVPRSEFREASYNPAAVHFDSSTEQH